MNSLHWRIHFGVYVSSMVMEKNVKTWWYILCDLPLEVCISSHSPFTSKSWDITIVKFGLWSQHLRHQWTERTFICHTCCNMGPPTRGLGFYRIIQKTPGSISRILWQARGIANTCSTRYQIPIFITLWKNNIGMRIWQDIVKQFKLIYMYHAY